MYELLKVIPGWENTCQRFGEDVRESRVVIRKKNYFCSNNVVPKSQTSNILSFFFNPYL